MGQPTMSQEEMFSIMDGMEQVNRDMADRIARKAPVCHFRKMTLEQEDSTMGDGAYYWECSVCGHTKDY
jgi:rubrerythrin